MSPDLKIATVYVMPLGGGNGGQRKGMRLHRQVKAQKSQKHGQAACPSIEKELDRRVQLARTTPDPDQEVHGDQHDLPEDVEQDEVEGAEHTEHPGLEQEQEDVVLLLADIDRALGLTSKQKRQTLLMTLGELLLNSTCGPAD